MSKRSNKLLVVIFLCFFCINFIGCSNENNSGEQFRVIVLGIDGMDANLVDSLITAGYLPNLKELAETGTFSPLRTTNPAESPVAWSSFITGKNPAKTNLFGFLSCNRESYSPEYAPTEFFPGNSGNFPYYTNQRKGDTFWETIYQARELSSAVLFCPETFPPEYKNGSIISGMEVPDIRGTTGTFSFYTTDSINYIESGNVIYLRSESDTFNTFIKGPKNWLKNNEYAKVPIQFVREKDTLKINTDINSFELDLEEWSDWKKISFRLNPNTNVSGIVRFYLRSLSPNISIYMSPVNINPEHPLFNISSPLNFSKQIAEENGLFATLGWASDTWALNDGFIDEEVFLESSINVFNERKEILFEQIESQQHSMIVSVFGELDRIQHMFWRYIDPKSPLYEKTAAPKIKNAIYNYYSMIDDMVGKILSKVDTSTTFIMVSDHGFAPFRKSVNLNTWLVKNGFMNLDGKGKDSEELFFPSVNWNATKAYALGIGGIYLNVAGREGKGIIKDTAEYNNVRNEIIKKLLTLEDPATGKQVVKNVYKREDIYEGKYLESAPDLIVGLVPGYRVSQASSLGRFEDDIFNHNLRKWSGDHVSVDPSFVRGIFFTSKKLDLDSIPGIMDITPTILEIFQVPIPFSMDGKSLLN